MTFVENKKGDLVYMTSPVIKARHAFTTRWGGVSRGVFESLDLSTGRGDDREAVEANYRRLGEATGIDTQHMAFTRQVHGNEVRVVTGKDVHKLFTDVPYDADGLVTAARGLALICFTADCVPVLLCDADAGVIAAVHCGWRSSVADILGAAVVKMIGLGAAPRRICAAIGPAIGYCCFEVGEEVVKAAYTLLGGDIEGLWKPREGHEGKYLLDLKGVNRRRLVQLGLAYENVCVSEECTMCRSEKYWSHRKTGGMRGSQGALIVLD